MFNDYIRKIMPCYVERIEQSEKNSYLYRITLSESLLNEYRQSIDKRLKTNERIKSYEGWFYPSYGYGFKQALIEFKKDKNTKIKKTS